MADKQAQALTESKLSELQKELCSHTGLQIQLEIDWSFLKSATFLDHDADTRKEIITNLSTKHAPNIVSPLEPDSLPKRCDSSEEFKQAIKDKVKKVVFTYDATNSVSDPVGCWGWFWTILLDNATRQLLVRINLTQVILWSLGLLCFHEPSA